MYLEGHPTSVNAELMHWIEQLEEEAVVVIINPLMRAARMEMKFKSMTGWPGIVGSVCSDELGQR